MKSKIYILISIVFCSLQSLAQKIGIGTNTPAAQLHTTGSIQFDTLSGTGNRLIYADSSGRLYADTTNSAAATAAQVFSNSTPAGISDLSCTISALSVSSMPTAINPGIIKITLNITHTFDGDLDIFLVAPNGQAIELSTDNGSGGDNYINTEFWDSAATSIVTGTAPFTGTYKPEGGLGNMVDCSYTNPLVGSFGGFGGGSMDPNGVWTLVIRDDAGGDVGTLNNWSITFAGSNLSSAFHYIPKWENGSFVRSKIFDDGSNVGIGTVTPSTALEVSGKVKTDQLQITSNAGVGKILTSDASGNATWVSPSTSPIQGTIAASGTLYGSNTSFQIPDSANQYRFFGPSAVVTLNGNQRVFINYTAGLGKTTAGNASFRLDVGYQSTTTGSPIFNASAGNYIIQQPNISANERNVYTMTGSFKPIAGTYKIGAVCNAPSINYFDNNDYCNGYYMIVNE